MTYDDYLDWCRLMDVSATKGAELLGLGRNVPLSYKRGTRIPPYIALACAALTAKLEPWPAINPVRSAG